MKSGNVRSGLEVLPLSTMKQLSNKDLLYGDPNWFYQPAIVPPVGGNKPYDLVTELAQVRALAASMLRETTELVVIGSQLRSDDQLLHSLIKGNLDPTAEIVLVAGHDPTTYSKVRSTLRSKGVPNPIKNTMNYFGEYTDAL